MILLNTKIKLREKTILLVLFLCYSCVTPKKGILKTNISVSDFGAIANDAISDDKAFDKAFFYLGQNQDVDTLIIPAGRYIFDNRIKISGIKDDIIVKGKGKVEIISSIKGVFTFRANKSEFILNKPINRNDSFLLTNVKLNLGDVLHIKSNSVWETGWNYKENDTQIVTRINEDSVFIKDKFIFNYNSNSEEVECFVNNKVKVSFENIDFIAESTTDWGKIPIVTIAGAEVNLKNISCTDLRKKTYIRGFSISNSPAIEFDSIKFENIEYGLLINFSRNINGKNVKGYHVRHAIAPATASENIYISNIYGFDSQGIIDAHQCFNVTYENIIDEKATGFPNCRALGIKILNAKFDVVKQYKQIYAYWSIQGLTSEYSSMYNEYDSYFENVDWVYGVPTNFNGLTCYYVRNFTVKNCKTHNVSVYGRPKGEIKIMDSEIGSIRVNNHGVQISNCILNGDYFKNADYVFRIAGKGGANIDNVVVKNYSPDNTALFGYFFNSPDKNSITIQDSKIQYLNSLAKEYLYPDRGYNHLNIINSDLQGFQNQTPERIKMNILPKD